MDWAEGPRKFYGSIKSNELQHYLSIYACNMQYYQIAVNCMYQYKEIMVKFELNVGWNDTLGFFIISWIDQDLNLDQFLDRAKFRLGGHFGLGTSSSQNGPIRAVNMQSLKISIMTCFNISMNVEVTLSEHCSTWHKVTFKK